NSSCRVLRSSPSASNAGGAPPTHHAPTIRGTDRTTRQRRTRALERQPRPHPLTAGRPASGRAPITYPAAPLADPRRTASLLLHLASRPGGVSYERSLRPQKPQRAQDGRRGRRVHQQPGSRYLTGFLVRLGGYPFFFLRGRIDTAERTSVRTGAGRAVLTWRDEEREHARRSGGSSS